MDFRIDRRSILKAGAALAAAYGSGRKSTGQADHTLCGGILDKDIRADMNPDAREGHRRRLHAAAFL